VVHRVVGLRVERAREYSLGNALIMGPSSCNGGRFQMVTGAHE
jgi:hypothetical protein